MIYRSDLSENFTLSQQKPVKTFVVESHADDPEACLSQMFPEARIQPTNDAFLFIAHLGDEEIWIDQINNRFWSFHTDMHVSDARKLLNESIESRRDLDWMWLPSQHVNKAWPKSRPKQVRTSFEGKKILGAGSPAEDLKIRLSGKSADKLLEHISQNQDYRSAVSFDSVRIAIHESQVGYVQEAVNYKGGFAATGDSFELHEQFVSTVVGRYGKLVSRIEEKSLAATSFDRSDFQDNAAVHENDTGWSLQGSVISVIFSRDIPDMERFISEVFTAKAPFRLWGIPKISDDVAHVHAVDLHVGQSLRLEIGQDWMRIYLPSDACGNIVTRLAANLQHRFDGALTFCDPGIHEIFSLEGREFSAS